MIKYSFYEKYHKNEKRTGILIIELYEKKYEMLGAFLMFDAVLDFECYKKIFEDILNNRKESEVINGEVSLLEIRKDYTIISDLLLDEEEMEGMEKEELECKIGTKELQKILLIWEKAYKVYKKDRLVLEGGVVE